MNNQSIDTKCFLVNIRKKDFVFKDKWGGVKTGEERDLQKVYQKGYRTNNFIKLNVLSDEVIYGSSFHEVKNKAMKIAKKDAVASNKKMIEERALEEAEVIKAYLDDRLSEIRKEIKATSDSKKLLEEEKEIANRLSCKYNGWHYNEERWYKETAKTLHEDLSLIIEANLVEDYEIKIKELKYIVVGSRSAIELSEKVNDHLDKGWNLLGGVQVGGAGGGDGTQRDWSEFQYVQSLTCGS